MNWFNWLYPSRYSGLEEVITPKKCNHRGSMYSAWDSVATTTTYHPPEDGKPQDILKVCYLERCYKCGEHRLVTHDIKAGTLTITKQVVEDPDVQ